MEQSDWLTIQLVGTTVVVLKSAEMKSGVLCVMIHGTTLMPV